MAVLVGLIWLRGTVTGFPNIDRGTAAGPEVTRNSFKTQVGWLGSKEVSPQAVVFWGFAALNPSHTLPKIGFETASKFCYLSRAAGGGRRR